MPIDYESLDSITEAFQGQDAVVSTIASAALATQLRLVEAAVKARVKRFLPSEFGSDTQNPKARTLPIFRDKIATQDALKKEGAAGSLTYTFVCTAPFFDWGIMVGFLINVKAKSIDLFDGGDRTFSATTLPNVGKAVVGVLKRPEETKNRTVYVQDYSTTQKKLVAFGKKAAGSDGWTENVVAIDDCLKRGYEELQKPNPNPQIFALEFIKASVFGEGYGGDFAGKLDNDLLGVKELSDAEVQEIVNKFAK